jgi:hypothetical protein
MPDSWVIWTKPLAASAAPTAISAKGGVEKSSRRDGVMYRAD